MTQGVILKDKLLKSIMYLISSRTNRLLYLIIVLMISISAIAQSSDKNYVQTKTFLDDAGTTFLRHIDYYDELGVVSETVDVGLNTTQTPILSRTTYTTQLKPYQQWAPVPVTGLDFLSEMAVLTVVRATYTDVLAYNENEYGDFQELTSTRKPGDAWEGDQGTPT